MASDVSGGMMSHPFPSLGPALMISMGYIDLGKWVAAVEGGARFGFDLVFFVLLFNCTAILCQYISTCIGTATGKNLAEICSEEYSKTTCMLLGVQAELSMIISDITMILGIGHGLNLMFGIDLFVGIFYATVSMIFLPLLLTILDNCKAEAVHIGIAGFALLFYVLGVLISQPEVPLMMSGIFPKLSGESAYSMMALLGANIMAHNFFIHSSIVKKRQPNVAMGALFHDHFFAILFIFTGIFLVNYVLINSAAAVFGSTSVVFNYPDVSILMDQIFRRPIAPIGFFLIIFFSSQITALTRNIGAQVIFQCFFGINFSWVHHALVKALSIIPVLYCAKITGAEGIYQLLIFCQVIMAMLLPSLVIPVFRVASSRFIMHAFKISWYLEIVALFAFLVMFASNIFFVIEMLFGNNSWMINLTGNAEGNEMIPFTVLLIIACASIGLTLHLAVTPLKSASDRPETQIWNSILHMEELPEGAEDNNLDIIKYDKNWESSVEDTTVKSIESQAENSMLDFSTDFTEMGIDSDHDSHQYAHSSSIIVVSMPPKYQLEEAKSVVEVDFIDTVDKSSVGCMSDVGGDERIDSNDPVLKDEGQEALIHTDKDNGVGDLVKTDESLKGFRVSSTSEAPESFNNANLKGLDESIGSGSLPKLPGLGRAARRQLAAILDEFWGNLYDFHGKLTREATANRLDVLLGLDFRTVDSSVKLEAIGPHAAKSYFPDADMGSVFPTNMRDYNSPKQMKNNGVDLPFGIQMGSSSWSQNMQSLDAHVQSSSKNLLDPSERLYSSLHLPQYPDNKDYQPATIHGYEIASHIRELGAPRYPYSSNSANLVHTPNSSSNIPPLRDQVLYTRAQSELGTLGNTGVQNPALSRMSRLQSKMSYYEAPFGEASESAVSSANTKKYHSSPDISAIIALGRTAYLNEAKRGVPIGPYRSSGRMLSEQSHHLNSVSRAGVPLAFDQLPPKLHRDVFGLNPETKNHWSRQPFEQLFGMTGKGLRVNDGAALERTCIPPKETSNYAESGAKLLQSLRLSIMKINKLEGSEWLFRPNGGSDEDIIDRISASEKYLHRADYGDMNQEFSGEHSQLSSDPEFSSFHRSKEVDGLYCQSVSNCVDGCVWRASLVVSFGVWCIRRILELSLIESRPELWGKYTYVLNRLQGIIEPAFSKPRQPLTPCYCLQTSIEDAMSINASFQNGLPRTAEKPKLVNSKSLTTASMVLEIIKDVEIALSGRKGRTGTAAGDVAFPKGKENLASVLKRYKRRLLNKPPGFHGSASTARKIPSSSSSSVV